MILSKNVLIFPKNIFTRGAFVWEITADAVGATSCRPVRRNGVIKNSPAIGPQIFYSHADCADFAEGAEPFGTIHDTNIQNGVGATLCRPAAPRGANTHIPHGKHAKPVRLRDFRAVCVRIKYPRADSRAIFYNAVSACGPT